MIMKKDILFAFTANIDSEIREKEGSHSKVFLLSYLSVIIQLHQKKSLN